MLTKPEPGQPILVNVGERVLELKFPLVELKALDKEHQISVLKGSGLVDVLQDPGKFAITLYHGLKTVQEDITIDWIERHVEASMLLTLAPLLAYAMTGRWPKMKGLTDDEEEENPTLPASRSIGSPSGPSVGTTSALVSGNSGG